MKLELSYPARLLTLATAYKAKLLCSGVFVSGRDPHSVLTTDLAVDTLAPLKAFRATVDEKQQIVTTSFLGLSRCQALYRPGLGSTLMIGSGVSGSSLEVLRQQGRDFAAWLQQNPRRHESLPSARTLPSEIDDVQPSQSVSQAVNEAFVEHDSARLKRTRAVVIVHKGRIVAERYAEGFSAEMPMLGWSMAKSVINALIGILVREGRLALEADHLLAEWRKPDDPRRHITLDQLLRMSSGLQFSEKYSSPLSDATTMLFQREDKARYAAALPLESSPDTTFSYASGTTVLLCRIIREALGGSLTDYFAFPQRALFDPLGMASAILEPDAAGTFTGSSFMYATARDWAKLGLLYLQDGCWRGERILSAGWVDYSTGLSKTTPYYGAHFWRGVPLSFTEQKQEEKESIWPSGAYLASGYQGQFMTVVPSHDLVIVRLGLSQRRYSWDHENFVSTIVSAIST